MRVKGNGYRSLLQALSSLLLQLHQILLKCTKDRSSVFFLPGDHISNLTAYCRALEVYTITHCIYGHGSYTGSSSHPLLHTCIYFPPILPLFPLVVRVLVGFLQSYARSVLFFPLSCSAVCTCSVFTTVYCYHILMYTIEKNMTNRYCHLSFSSDDYTSIFGVQIT